MTKKTSKKKAASKTAKKKAGHTTAKRKQTSRGEPIKFFAKHFWAMMKDQKYRCALTGRELTPDNTEVELREPFLERGRTEIRNHYIVVRDLSYTARHATEEAIVELAADIIRFRGKEFGYGLRSGRK